MFAKPIQNVSIHFLNRSTLRRYKRGNFDFWTILHVSGVVDYSFQVDIDRNRYSSLIITESYYNSNKLHISCIPETSRYTVYIINNVYVIATAVIATYNNHGKQTSFPSTRKTIRFDRSIVGFPWKLYHISVLYTVFQQWMKWNANSATNTTTVCLNNKGLVLVMLLCRFL